MNDDNARPCLYVIAKLLWIFDAGNVQYAALTMCRGVMEWWRWPGARNLFPKHCLYMSVYFNFRTKIDINICMNMLGLFLINITVANIFSITDILQLIYFTDCYFIFIYFFVRKCTRNIRGEPNWSIAYAGEWVTRNDCTWNWTSYG